MFSSIEDAARETVLEMGFNLPKSFEYDQFIQLEDKNGKKNQGRLMIFADGKGGFVHDWRGTSSTSKKYFFLQGKGKAKPLSNRERQRIESERRKRQAEDAARKDRAGKRALAIWQDAKPAPLDHPYLIAKQIKPHGARVAAWQRIFTDDGGHKKTVIIDNALLIPLFDADGKIRSLQAIFPAKHSLLERNKDFLPGGGLAGLFWWIGAKTDTVLICEGFATGATLHEQTGYRVYIAFSANNLKAVGLIVREKLPDAEIIFAADNDTETVGNPGVTKATEAAALVGAGVIVPPIRAADFNDYQIFLNGGGRD